MHEVCVNVLCESEYFARLEKISQASPFAPFPETSPEALHIDMAREVRLVVKGGSKPLRNETDGFQNLLSSTSTREAILVALARLRHTKRNKIVREGNLVTIFQIWTFSGNYKLLMYSSLLSLALPLHKQIKTNRLLCSAAFHQYIDIARLCSATADRFLSTSSEFTSPSSFPLIRPRHSDPLCEYTCSIGISYLATAADGTRGSLFTGESTNHSTLLNSTQQQQPILPLES